MKQYQVIATYKGYVAYVGYQQARSKSEAIRVSRHYIAVRYDSIKATLVDDLVESEYEWLLDY